MSHQPNRISFDNTEHAFAYKSDQELKKAHFLSGTGNPFMLKLGLAITPWAIRFHFPFTVLPYVGRFSASLLAVKHSSETAGVADKLESTRYRSSSITALKAGKGRDAFDHATDEFIRVIDYAATQHNIPFMSIKVTGVARFGLLEKWIP